MDEARVVRVICQLTLVRQRTGEYLGPTTQPRNDKRRSCDVTHQPRARPREQAPILMAQALTEEIPDHGRLSAMRNGVQPAKNTSRHCGERCACLEFRRGHRGTREWLYSSSKVPCVKANAERIEVLLHFKCSVFSIQHIAETHAPPVFSQL
jgi:hypothetical protein